MITARWEAATDSDTASGKIIWFDTSGSASNSGRRVPSVSGSIRHEVYPLYAPKEEPEERPKYDPYNARRLWQPEVLQVTIKPRKRPRSQVEFNQVSKLRPVRPRYLSRKR